MYQASASVYAAMASWRSSVQPLLGLEYEPHSTLARGAATRDSEAYELPIIWLYALFHGSAFACTLERMKSSCDWLTSTPGWANEVGAAAAVAWTETGAAAGMAAVAAPVPDTRATTVPSAAATATTTGARRKRFRTAEGGLLRRKLRMWGLLGKRGARGRSAGCAHGAHRSTGENGEYGGTREYRKPSCPWLGGSRRHRRAVKWVNGDQLPDRHALLTGHGPDLGSLT